MGQAVGDGSRFWRTDEIRILREHYAAAGADACAPLLPARSLNAIKAQACRLGLLAPRVERPDGWFHSRITPEIRTELRLLAGKTVSWKRVKALAQKWRMTPQGALRRLQYAGATLAPTKIPWTREQDDVLRALSDRPTRHAAPRNRRQRRTVAVARQAGRCQADAASGR